MRGMPALVLDGLVRAPEPRVVVVSKDTLDFGSLVGSLRDGRGDVPADLELRYRIPGRDFSQLAELSNNGEFSLPSISPREYELVASLSFGHGTPRRLRRLAWRGERRRAAGALPTQNRALRLARPPDAGGHELVERDYLGRSFEERSLEGGPGPAPASRELVPGLYRWDVDSSSGPPASRWFVVGEADGRVIFDPSGPASVLVVWRPNSGELPASVPLRIVNTASRSIASALRRSTEPAGRAGDPARHRYPVRIRCRRAPLPTRFEGRGRHSSDHPAGTRDPPRARRSGPASSRGPSRTVHRRRVKAVHPRRSRTRRSPRT